MTNQITIIREAIHTTNLLPDQRTTLSSRFLSLLEEYRGRSRRYSCAFNALRIIITVGSLIVPALLSVQYAVGNVGSTNTSISSEVYWVVWNLSLFVTISNGVMSLLKVDKKYFTLNTTYEHLLSEGWQFVHLSGKYSGFYTPGMPASHNNQFVFFCNMIEKIRMKQVEEEYYKIDQAAHTQGGHALGAHEQLIPPTPANPGATRLPFSGNSNSDQKSIASLKDEESTADNTPKIFITGSLSRPHKERPTVLHVARASSPHFVGQLAEAEAEPEKAEAGTEGGRDEK
jgi:hypothetical protein